MFGPIRINGAPSALMEHHHRRQMHFSSQGRNYTTLDLKYQDINHLNF
jgi:hypothetical protein